MYFESIKLAYFSPNGTTKTVSEAIARGIDTKYDTINLTKPDNASKTHLLESTDLTIIAIPVYSGRAPKTAVERVSRLKGDNTPTVLVTVYGNRDIDDAMLELNDVVTPLGFKTLAGASFIGEHSFNIPEFGVAVSRPDEEDVEKARLFGRKVRENVEGLSGFPDLQVPGKRPYRDYHPLINDLVRINTDSSTCTMCGKCADACPTGAVRIGDSVSTEDALCAKCHACIRVCPVGARAWENDRFKDVTKWLVANCSERKEPKFFL